jgi:hypothetical protein
VLIAFTIWRTRASFVKYAFATNALLMTGGFVLTGWQLAGYVLS